MRTTAMFLLTVLVCQNIQAQRPPRAVVPRVGQMLTFNRFEGVQARGTVTALDHETVLVTMNGQELRLDDNQLSGARVAAGTQPATMRGLKTGALVGTVVGAIVGAIAEGHDDSQGIAVSAGLVFGALTGSVVGAGIGSMGETATWARMALPGDRPARFSQDLQAGDGVRVMRTGSKLTGVVIGGTGDTTRIRLDSGETTDAPVTSLERYAGERSRAGKGMLVGGALGLVLGGLSIASMDESRKPPTSGVVAGVALNGALFALVGGLVMSGTAPSWTRVTPDRPREITISPTITPGRFGLVARMQM